jgi:hypothetical protein
MWASLRTNFSSSVFVVPARISGSPHLYIYYIYFSRNCFSQDIWDVQRTRRHPPCVSLLSLTLAWVGKRTACWVVLPWPGWVRKPSRFHLISARSLLRFVSLLDLRRREWSSCFRHVRDFGIFRQKMISLSYTAIQNVNSYIGGRWADLVTSLLTLNVLSCYFQPFLLAGIHQRGHIFLNPNSKYSEIMKAFVALMVS